MHALLLQVYDYEDNGKHRLLGECETNVLKLKELMGEACPHGMLCVLWGAFGC